MDLSPEWLTIKSHFAGVLIQPDGGGDGERVRKRGNIALKTAAWVAAAILLSSCAAPRSYMGIAFDSPSVGSDLRSLAQRAQAGDKQAQLELGIAFEEGRGVPVDVGRARKLYMEASSASGGLVAVYVPGVGGARGQVQMLGETIRQPGLPEAAIRLSKISESKVSSPVMNEKLPSHDLKQHGHILCRLAHISVQNAIGNNAESISDLVSEEYITKNPDITRLEWTNQAIFALFPDVHTKEKNEYSGKLYSITTTDPCILPERQRAEIYRIFNIYPSNKFLSLGGVTTNDIFDVIPRTYYAKNYAITLNFSRDSGMLISAFALIME